MTNLPAQRPSGIESSNKFLTGLSAVRLLVGGMDVGHSHRGRRSTVLLFIPNDLNNAKQFAQSMMGLSEQSLVGSRNSQAASFQRAANQVATDWLLTDRLLEPSDVHVTSWNGVTPFGPHFEFQPPGNPNSDDRLYFQAFKVSDELWEELNHGATSVVGGFPQVERAAMDAILLRFSGMTFTPEEIAPPADLGR